MRTLESNNPASHHYEVHSMPTKGMQQIHRDYGLWIIGGSDSYIAPPDSFLTCPERYFEYYSVSHMHDGSGRLWLASEPVVDIMPGQCVIICPKTINRYGGTDGQVYTEDSLRFWGPAADMLRHSGVVKDGVFELGQARRLLPIIQLAADPARDAQINANMALQKLLVDIYNTNKRSGNSHADVVIDHLIATIKEQLNRWWTVREMAEFCNLSTFQFRRLFLKRVGILPKIYVDRLKIQKAGEMLAANRLKVAEITERLGYIDQYHFSRRFKKITGMSPRLFRQTFPGHR